MIVNIADANLLPWAQNAHGSLAGTATASRRCASHLRWLTQISWVSQIRRIILKLKYTVLRRVGHYAEP